LTHSLGSWRSPADLEPGWIFSAEDRVRSRGIEIEYLPVDSRPYWYPRVMRVAADAAAKKGSSLLTSGGRIVVPSCSERQCPGHHFSPRQTPGHRERERDTQSRITKECGSPKKKLAMYHQAGGGCVKPQAKVGGHTHGALKKILKRRVLQVFFFFSPVGVRVRTTLGLT
jgi:hypothetical protein